MDESQRIVFILGGPGSGKGTQSEMIEKHFGYRHLSTGDLLRMEVKLGTDLGKSIESIMEKGDLVDIKIVFDLLKKAVCDKSSSKGVLIDGFPRSVEQAKMFKEIIRECDDVIYLEASDETMRERLIGRGKASGRVDDNIVTIDKRLKTFHNETEPLLTHYGDKVRSIPAIGSPDEIFKKIRVILSSSS